MVWIVAYIQAALEHLRQSVGRRTKTDKATGVSRRLARVIEQLTSEKFKELKPMELQLDSYTPIASVEQVSVVPLPDTVVGKPTTAKKPRSKSRKFSDLPDAMNGARLSNRSFASFYAAECQAVAEGDPTRSKADGGDFGTEATPQASRTASSDSRRRTFKDLCEPIMLASLAARKDWKLATKLATASANGKMSTTTSPKGSVAAMRRSSRASDDSKDTADKSSKASISKLKKSDVQNQDLVHRAIR
jgi:hypothetical protein